MKPLTFPVRPQTWAPVLLQAAVLSALAPMPSQAVVKLAAKTAPDTNAASSSKDLVDSKAAKAVSPGASLTCVVKLDIILPGAVRWAHATGAYLGAGKDGRTGYIVTVGHPMVLHGPPAAHNSLEKPLVRIQFGQGEDAAVLKVPATGILLHGGFGTFVDEDKAVDGESFTLFKNDLALLTFDAAACKDRLSELKIRPAVLYGGKGYLKPEPCLYRHGNGARMPLLDALVVGFGESGTSESGFLDPASSRAHAGYLKVSYGPLGKTGFKAFLSYAALTPESVQAKRINLQLPSQSLAELLEAAPRILDQVPAGPLTPKVAAARKQLEAARKAPASRAKEAAAALAAALPNYNLCRFQPTPRLTGYINPFNKEEECLVYVQSPKEDEVMVTHGDSGAPLFFRWKRPEDGAVGYALAALVSGAEHLPLVPVEDTREEGKAGETEAAGPDLRPFAVSFFQPVVDQRELIQAAMAGDARGFKAQECGSAQDWERVETPSESKKS